MSEQTFRQAVHEGVQRKRKFLDSQDIGPRSWHQWLDILVQKVAAVSEETVETDAATDLGRKSLSEALVDLCVSAELMDIDLCRKKGKTNAKPTG